MSPRREKLTSPQTRIALARGNRPVQHLQPVPEPVDTEAARALFQAQRRTAVRTVVVLSVLLFGLSGSFALFPVLGEIRLAQVPLSWLLLTVAVYPLLFGLALWHVRSTERLEGEVESADSGRSTTREVSRRRMDRRRRLKSAPRTGGGAT